VFHTAKPCADGDGQTGEGGEEEDLEEGRHGKAEGGFFVLELGMSNFQKVGGEVKFQKSSSRTSSVHSAWGRGRL
jgi:hypothetical protein